jgi:hypothetical protein
MQWTMTAGIHYNEEVAGGVLPAGCLRNTSRLLWLPHKSQFLADLL